jgi:hypothetical protein
LKILLCFTIHLHERKMCINFHLQVVWGRISMVDAERRLLANALRDTSNQQFVLLSDRWFSWFLAFLIDLSDFA